MWSMWWNVPEEQGREAAGEEMGPPCQQEGFGLRGEEDPAHTGRPHAYPCLDPLGITKLYKSWSLTSRSREVTGLRLFSRSALLKSRVLSGHPPRLHAVDCWPSPQNLSWLPNHILFSLFARSSLPGGWVWGHLSAHPGMWGSPRPSRCPLLMFILS